MAQNHYDNGVQQGQGHARISLDHRRAKDYQYSGFAAQINSPPPPVMFGGQRGINRSNWANTGPGMQAIFLGPKKNSCGTGVFIPRGQFGTHLQFIEKPVFSPVLLPSRVIQALNLNVHELGQHIKPPQSQSAEENKIDDDDVGFSPEVFLPKEWTY